MVLGMLWTIILIIVAIIVIILLLKLVFAIIAIGPIAMEGQQQELYMIHEMLTQTQSLALVIKI
ncbi:MAG TPA: hypothetical protein VH796_11065 [Nitrososphaeraceae archaeon]|jgi:hypothetical protein